MHPNPNRGRGEDARDRHAEAAILDRVFEPHPTHPIERELSLDLVGDALPAIAEKYERAIRDLVAADLPRTERKSILPTLAAVHAAEPRP